MDLKKLSRDDKLKLIQALEEKDRRARLKKDVYKPNSGQLQVHKSDRQQRLVISGNGSGKTAMALHEAVWAAEGFNPLTQKYIPVPRKIGIVLDKPSKVGDKYLPEFNKWFDTSNWEMKQRGKPYVELIRFPNGSEIQFYFHEMDPLTFESVEIDDLIADEPMPRHVYVALKRGQRNKGKEARTLMIGTPITGAWVRREILEPWAAGNLPNTECFKFGTAVNAANLPDNYIEEYSAILSEKERKIRLEGEFFDLDGLALAHLFKREKHVLPIDAEWDRKYPCAVAIDPHPNKPHYALLVGADEYGPVVLKELSLKIEPRKFARELKKWYEGYRVIDLVCDSLGSADSTGGEGFKSFIQVLNDEGIRVRSTTYDDKNDADWLMRIQEVLAIPTTPDNLGTTTPKLRIMSNCRGLISDIENVSWTKYRNLDEYKPTLDISNKDYLACLKYALATNISSKKKKDSVFYRNDEAYGVNLARKAKMKMKTKLKGTKSW